MLGSHCDLCERLWQGRTAGQLSHAHVLANGSFRGVPAWGWRSVCSRWRIVSVPETPWCQLHKGITVACGEGALLSHALEVISELALRCLLGGTEVGVRGIYYLEYKIRTLN